MEITKLGRKAVNDRQLKLYMLDIAVMHLAFHKTPRPAIEEILQEIVARYLAARPDKRGFRPAVGYELDGIVEFISNHADLINPIVQETIQAATDTTKAISE